MNRNNTLVFGLLWHSLNSDNMGVGALTVGHIQILREVSEKLGFDCRFVVLCWSDNRPLYFEDPSVEIVKLRMKDILNPLGSFPKAVAKCDLVLDIGAGDSFSDIYGASRILKMLVAQYIVLFLKKPLILSPQTLGPFSKSYVRQMACGVLNRAYAVVSRDNLSVDYVKKLGISRPVIMASDVALRLPYENANTNDVEKVHVGLNVSGLLLSGGYTKSNMFGLTTNYKNLVTRIINYFDALENCQVHLVAHVISSENDNIAPSDSEMMKIEDDYMASKKLLHDYPNTILAPQFRSPSEAKSYISGLDYMIGSRMHACIAALSSGTAVMPVAYSRKFLGMFSALGYHDIADCTKESEDELFKKVVSGYENRSELSEKAAAAFNLGLERLFEYEKTLTECIDSKVSSSRG